MTRSLAASLVAAALLTLAPQALAAPAVTALDLVPGASGSMPTLPIAHAGAAFFAATTATGALALFASDGTSAGTSLIKALPAGTISQLGAVPGGFVFVVGETLFRSDGTSAGTVPVMNLPRVPASATSVTYRFVGSTGSVAILARYTSPAAARILRTDGTVQGTFDLPGAVIDINVPLFRRDLMRPAVDGGYLYWFSMAYSSVFRTNGQTLERVPRSSTFDGSAMIACNGAVWIQNSTLTRIAGDTVTDIGQVAYGTPMGCVGNKTVFYSSDGGTGIEPWATDGTAAGRVRLADIAPGAASAIPTAQNLPMISVAGKVVLYGCEAAGSCALFATDGTPGGTKKLGAVASQVREVGRIGARVYLATDTTPSTLYATDGVTLTALAVTDAPPVQPSLIEGGATATVGRRILHRTKTTATVGAEPWVLHDPEATPTPDSGTPESSGAVSGAGSSPAPAGARDDRGGGGGGGGDDVAPPEDGSSLGLEDEPGEGGCTTAARSRARSRHAPLGLGLVLSALGIALATRRARRNSGPGASTCASRDDEMGA